MSGNGASRPLQRSEHIAPYQTSSQRRGRQTLYRSGDAFQHARKASELGEWKLGGVIFPWVKDSSSAMFHVLRIPRR
jgi:hypothetical protein